jgi:hypothetical protein
LTEVVQPALPTATARTDTAAADAARIVDAVLAGLRQQLDATLAQQVREAMTPALALAVERLVHETRLALARTLRDQVEQAVAHALGAAAPPPAPTGAGDVERGTGLAG